MTDLEQHYQRNADATGHSPECRRRVVPTIMSDHRAFDPERCERCRTLTERLNHRCKHCGEEITHIQSGCRSGWIHVGGDAYCNQNVGDAKATPGEAR